MMKRLTLVFLLLSCFMAMSYSQVYLSDKHDNQTFPLVSSRAKVAVYCDNSDELVVKRAAKLFIEDVERVTKTKLQLYSKLPSGDDYILLIGTLGKSELIDRLVADKKLDVSQIRNGWEQYVIDLVETPFSGIKKALVIAGSDRRGTAYGVFSVSEAIGVSPWYWWADAPVVQRKTLALGVNRFASKSPSVKYRGIFINDEDWGLKP